MLMMKRWIAILATCGCAGLAGMTAGAVPADGRPDFTGRPPMGHRSETGSVTSVTAEPSPTETEDEDQEAAPDKQPDRFLAVKAGVVYTASGPVLTDATILCKNGRITAIGAGLAIPDGAEVLDATGYRVYPGLVAVASSRVVGGEPVADNTDVYGLSMTLALAGGMTTVLSGTTVAKLTFGSLDDHVIRKDAFVTLNYGTNSPNARRKLRASFDKLRQYLRDQEAYERDKKTNPDAKPPDDTWIKGPARKHLQLLRGQAVGITTANTAHQLLDVCDLAQSYGIRMIVRGAREGWTVAPRLARAGVGAFVTPRTAVARDKRLNRPNGSSIENAAILYRHGVRVAIIPSNSAITTWGVAGRDLLHLAMEAAFGVRGGLPQDAAIRAITIDAARMLGVDHRVGSIEVGKDADFAIVDGDLLHYMTLVRWTVVDGRIVYDKDKDTLFDHIRAGGDPDAPPPDDYWPKRLGAVQTEPRP